MDTGFMRSAERPVEGDDNGGMSDPSLQRSDSVASQLKWLTQAGVEAECNDLDSHVQAPEELNASISEFLGVNMIKVLQLLIAADKDGDGQITPQELERAMFFADGDYTKEEVALLFNGLDEQQSGYVTLPRIMDLKRRVMSPTGQNNGTPISKQLDALARKNLKAKAASEGSGQGLIFQVLAPAYGAVWRGTMRPHAWLEQPAGWRTDHGAPVQRQRLTYTTGSVPREALLPLLVDTYKSMQRAAEIGARELDDLLYEVRQVDLRMEEVCLSCHPLSAGERMEKDNLRVLLCKLEDACIQSFVKVSGFAPKGAFEWPTFKHKRPSGVCHATL